jgi:hypothetical protein
MYPHQRFFMHPPNMLWSDPVCRTMVKRRNGFSPVSLCRMQHTNFREFPILGTSVNCAPTKG